jgi:hypothetical protein
MQPRQQGGLLSAYANGRVYSSSAMLDRGLRSLRCFLLLVHKILHTTPVSIKRLVLMCVCVCVCVCVFRGGWVSGCFKQVGSPAVSLPLLQEFEALSLPAAVAAACLLTCQMPANLTTAGLPLQCTLLAKTRAIGRYCQVRSTSLTGWRSMQVL